MKKAKPIASFALSPDVVEMIIELAELTGWSRSRCVEECIRYAFPEIKKRFLSVKTKREGEAREVEEEKERLREEYWRKVLTGQIRAEEWEPEWWLI
jgi:predicted transcriptional regulator